MSQREDDLRLERELRELLRGRDPGPAPYGLRGRVDRVPEGHPVGRRASSQARSALLVVAGLAVAAALVVAIAPLAGIREPWNGSGSSPVVSSPATGVPFDPTLVGPGVMTEPLTDPMPVVLAAGIFLAIAAFAIPGRRRVIPFALVAILVAYTVAATQLPVSMQDSGYGQGLSTLMAEPRPPSREEILWQLAGPREPFSAGVWVSMDAAVPVTLEGIIETWTEEDRDPGRPTWRAVWLDEQGDSGGMTGPGTPFHPVEYRPGEHWPLWLVGRAGACALGPQFDPEHPEAATAYAEVEQISAQVRVLGWPRTVTMALPFRLAEPLREQCSPR